MHPNQAGFTREDYFWLYTQQLSSLVCVWKVRKNSTDGSRRQTLLPYLFAHRLLLKREKTAKTTQRNSSAKRENPRMRAMVSRFWLLLTALLCLSVSVPAMADPAPFDLSGPTLVVTVTRAGVTLPIAQVPNLQPGDQIMIRADFPNSQSVHYLMVAAFLRGSTNPPPAHWFYRDEPWSHQGARGLHLTVPPGAQQLVVFLAPETGGDFKTLVNAVEHRPGAFVRASQELNHATLDRSRLDHYLAGVRETNADDPSGLQHAALMLARSLSINLNNTCFDQYSEEQAPCLMQGQDTLVLADPETSNIAEELSNGNVAALAMDASSMPQAHYGYYSPYVSSVIDIARIMSSFHNPQYQYIPALATFANDQMHLRLNTPPSFSSPKSVIVVALPAVEPPQPPPLHAVDPTSTYCAENSALVLPVAGAPLVFSTAYAHNMVLRLTNKNGKQVELPAQANALKGGFVIDTSGLSAKDFGNTVSASLHGYWGFDRYDGPNFELENAHPQPWLLAEADSDSVIAGHDDVVHLNTGNAACVENIAMADGPGGRERKIKWTQLKPTEVELTLPLKHTQPGPVQLVVHQFGFAEPETVLLHSFAEAAHLDGFSLHAGDTEGVLKGNRLNEVEALVVNDVSFTPAKPQPAKGAANAKGELTLTAIAKNKAKCAQFTVGTATASVRLKDGRTLSVATTIEPPRPQVSLISKNVQTAADDKSNIALEDPSELPEDATLTFSIHAITPASFSRDEQIEVSTADHAFTTTLNLQNGGLVLQDEHTALATLDPAKAFGGSAFGPLQFRVVASGVPGSWQPLVTLVRLPRLRRIRCIDGTTAPCQLTGSDLFLIQAVASDPAFQSAVQVPDGFAGDQLIVPNPAGGQLYVKLRDDPTIVNQITLAPPPAAPAATPALTPAPARPEYVPSATPTTAPTTATAPAATTGAQTTTGVEASPNNGATQNSVTTPESATTESANPGSATTTAPANPATGSEPSTATAPATTSQTPSNTVGTSKTKPAGQTPEAQSSTNPTTGTTTGQSGNEAGSETGTKNSTTTQPQ